MNLKMTRQDKIDTTPNPDCILCKGGGTILYRDLEDALFGVPGIWNLKKCVNPQCGLIWLDPAPKKEELSKAYLNYHTHLSSGFNLNKILLSMAKRVITLVELPFHFLSGIYRERCHAKYMFLETLSPGRLLDVGCGGGRFLHRMMKKGWNVNGVDKDPDAVVRVTTKYNIPVKTGTLQEAHFPDTYFDAITLSHMIEHEDQPLMLMKEINRLLKPGGTLVLVTPNTDSLAHLRFGKYWRGLEPPRHLFLYSPRSLSRLMEKSEFESRSLIVSTLSSDSAGIYYASLKMENDKENSLSSIIPCLIESVYMKYREYFIRRKNPDCGEDIVLLAKKR
jgi:2-polyprenyl-3-methyl-5-hydroxy-6-metoxy-1,4-benzoquinol methylase